MSTTPRADLPTGTVTFLFTDIEGSTRLSQKVGERFSQIVSRHHQLLREAMTMHRGIEVSTEGDAFFLVFQDARDATNAAAAAQRALDYEDWGEYPVKVRMGMHTGQGTLGGDNYAGLDVNRAARISDAAHGGQVVMSGATASLVERHLPEETELVDLGEHRLKDLELPERIYQLTIGDQYEFPPLRTLSARPNNLPAQLSSFVDRPHEVAAIREHLATSRLVTLTGPGGTGKTRLALQVAADCLTTFKDGVFVVQLSAVSDVSLVPSTVAAELGIGDEGTRTPTESLSEYLSDRELLLVLDNFEQIVEAAPFVTELLSSASRLKILVTSRAALRVSGEQEYPVPPMGAPDPEQLPDLETLAHYEAVALFLERARAVKRDFDLTAENARAIAMITQRLDGLPLAIELAAARTRILSPADLFKRLEDCFAVLATGGADREPRQRTLRGAIQWSYDLLDDAEKTFFRRLGVLTGTWSFEAAEAICNPNAEVGIDALDGLESLVDKSLVRRLENERGETRFRLLQTIREYALDMLGEAGEEADMRRRHAAYMFELADQHGNKITASIEWQATFMDLFDNLRAALRWALDNGEIAIGLGTAGPVWRLWLLRGQLAEGRAWLTELLEHPDAQDVPARALAIQALGSITYWQNDFEATRRYYEEGLEMSRELGDEGAIAEGLYNLGYLSSVEQKYEEAKTLQREARALYEKLGDEAGVANTALGLGLASALAGDHDLAMSEAQRAHEYFAPRNEWYGMMMTNFVMYQVHRFRGEYEEARNMMLAEFEFLSRGADPMSIASALDSMADNEIVRGYPERGIRLAGAAARLKDDAGGAAPPALIAVADPRELARKSLSEEEIERLWAEGYAMSTEEARIYAMKDSDAG
jgi:predicted ATPase/class 3 adenylate cyclase